MGRLTESDVTSKINHEVLAAMHDKARNYIGNNVLLKNGEVSM